MLQQCPHTVGAFKVFNMIRNLGTWGKPSRGSVCSLQGELTMQGQVKGICRGTLSGVREEWGCPCSVGCKGPCLRVALFKLPEPYYTHNIHGKN